MHEELPAGGAAVGEHAAGASEDGKDEAAQPRQDVEAGQQGGLTPWALAASGIRNAEVRGSTPLCSTFRIKHLRLARASRFLIRCQPAVRQRVSLPPGVWLRPSRACSGRSSECRCAPRWPRA